MERILLTGASHFLGQKIERSLSPKYEIAGNHAFLDRVTVDYANKINAKLIHISSAAIFNGNRGNYTETGEPNPNTSYGLDQLDAESIARKAPGAIILRLGLVYGFNALDADNGFFGRVISGEGVKLDNGQQQQPLFADDVSSALELLVRGDHFGTFHLAGPETMTEFKLGQMLEAQVHPNKYTVAPLDSEPKLFSLDVSKMQDLGMNFTPTREAFGDIRQQIIEDRLLRQTLRWANRWSRLGREKIG